MAQEITRTAKADEIEEIDATMPLMEEVFGGLAGYGGGAFGPILPVSVFEDPNYSTSDSPATSYTPVAGEDSSTPS